MPQVILLLQQQVADLTALVKELQAQNAALQAENKLLRQKNQLLLKRLFGRKSEQLDPRQLPLLLGELEQLEVPVATPPPDDTPPTRPRGKRGPREARLPEDLPTEEVVIDPDEVKRDPTAYRCIGQDVTEELDVNPAQYVRRLYIRRKYVAVGREPGKPVQAAMPKRPIEGSYASAGLLTDIVLKKYVDHLPLHRQEQILHRRYGIELSRQTMCDWVWRVADWCKPVVQLIRAELQSCGYLQVDETPVRYALAEGGGSAQGYFWVFRDPASRQVLYEWYTSRSARCLDGMCGNFKGKLQSDGYIAYPSFVATHEAIDLAGCWAHARRKFHEAQEDAPALAGWFLHQIGLLYRVEAKLRAQGASPTLRGVVRAAESQLVLDRIEKALRLKVSSPLPKSPMGLAIAYALGQWKYLVKYATDGRLEIDNNGVENAIRPTALGKKNWLFIGHPEAGERSAILYTLLENCKQLDIHPGEYLKDLLTRLPGLKINEIADLTPARWKAARQARAA